MKKKLKIGIIGAGLNTRVKHIPGFQAIDGVQVVAVSNRSKESGEKVANEFNIPKVYESWPDLIDDGDERQLLMYLQEKGWNAPQSRAIINMAKKGRN